MLHDNCVGDKKELFSVLRSIIWLLEQALLCDGTFCVVLEQWLL